MSNLICRNRILDLSTPVIMGTLNITADSFYDGGNYLEQDKAIARAMVMVAEGAKIIDIGGESTRPGLSRTAHGEYEKNTASQTISVAQEIDRVLPIVELLLREFDVIVSVDTKKTEVMREVLAAGAHMINDINALRDRGAVDVVAQFDAAVCLMHMQGTPQDMQLNPEYVDILREIHEFLQARVDECLLKGVKASSIVVDPGFGFGKTLQHNLTLLRNLEHFASLGYPVLAGISRKSMLGAIVNEPVENRLYAGIAANLFALLNGAKIIRTHDVKPISDIIKVFAAVEQESVANRQHVVA